MSDEVLSVSLDLATAITARRQACATGPPRSGWWRARARRQSGLAWAVYEGDARRGRRAPSTRPVVAPVVVIVVVEVDVAVVVVVTVPPVPVVAPLWVPIFTGAPVIGRERRHRLGLSDAAGQSQSGQPQDLSLIHI